MSGNQSEQGLKGSGPGKKRRLVLVEKPVRASSEVDLLIVNGLVVTLEEKAAPIPEGYVAVLDGVLVGVGPVSELNPELKAGKVIDAAGGLVMPGLINAHTHAAMTLFRGLADDLPLMEWLSGHIFPAEAAHVDEELVYWGTKLALAEMLLSGTTGLADGYFFEDEAARAVEEVGLRAVLGQGVLDFPAPGVPDPAENLARAWGFLERWQGVSPLMAPSVFCHSPYTCSAATLTQAKALAREKGVLFQIHVAETAGEVEKVRAEQGLTPVRYLDSLGLLDEKTLAVHCVHLEDEEIELLAARGTPVVLCPESHMKLASGLARLPEMLAQGLTVALGTDGAASNNDLNLFGEIRSAALVHKAAQGDPTVVPAAQALTLAGPGGARALGWGERVGVLSVGREADLIVLESEPPHLRPLYNPFSHLTYAATGREVRTVVVRGRVLVEEGRLTGLDLAETLTRVREIARRIQG